MTNEQMKVLTVLAARELHDAMLAVDPNTKPEVFILLKSGENLQFRAVGIGPDAVLKAMALIDSH